MDLAYWGLREHPFRITVVPGHWSLLPHQAQAARQLASAFRAGERVALLVGPHGVGKTLLAQHLTGEAEAQGKLTAWAACVPVVGSQALYQMLLADLGQPFSLRSTIELRMQLSEHLLPLVHEGKSVLVVIDEAQHIPLNILEELRPLIEMVTPVGQPGVQLLLTGTEQLLSQFAASPELAISHWVGCKSVLKPLDHDAASAFLQHAWKQVGGDPRRQATEEAWTMVAELAAGLPLTMNRLAGQAFRLAQDLQQRSLDGELVWEAGTELGLTAEDDVEPTVPIPRQSIFKESA